MSGKKRIPYFNIREKGVSVKRMNSMVESINRLDRIFARPGISGALVTDKVPSPEAIRLVRMSQPMGPDESSEFRDRTGVVQYWNSTQYKWMDSKVTGVEDSEKEIDVVTMPYGHVPIPENTIVATYFHKQSGKHIVLNPPQVVHIRTVEPYTGDYPAAGEGNVYPIAYITTAYENQLGEQELSESEIMEDTVNRIVPSPPHGGKEASDTKYGYVYNLVDTYIPIDTDLHAWFYCGQLYTAYSSAGGELGVVTAEVSAMPSTTWPFTFGVGTVMRGQFNRFDELESSGTELTVLNSTYASIPVGKLVQIKYIHGRPFVDVVPCDQDSA